MRIVEHLIERSRFRHDGHRACHISSERSAGHDQPQEILHVHDADDVIDITLVDRIAGLGPSSENFFNFFPGSLPHAGLSRWPLQIESDNSWPRHHELPGGAQRQPQGLVQALVFLRFEQSLVPAPR